MKIFHFDIYPVRNISNFLYKKCLDFIYCLNSNRFIFYICFHSIFRSVERSIIASFFGFGGKGGAIGATGLGTEGGAGEIAGFGGGAGGLLMVGAGFPLMGLIGPMGLTGP